MNAPSDPAANKPPKRPVVGGRAVGGRRTVVAGQVGGEARLQLGWVVAGRPTPLDSLLDISEYFVET